MSPGILDQVLDKVSNLQGMYAYGSIFGVLLACGLGLPMPEDITLVISGYLSYLENIRLIPTIVVCLFGVLAGDFILFMLGRIFGRKILKLPIIKHIITPERLNYATEKLKKNARKVCFIARFLAGLRAPVYLAAGIAGVRISTFLILDFLAAIISVPIWIYLGYYFGDELDIGFHYARRAERYILLVLAIVGVYFIVKKLFFTEPKKGTI